MTKKMVVLLGFTLLSSLAAAAQSVIVTPRKTVYRRPKPLHEFKRTFTIRRPLVQATTTALSQKITQALRPETVLDINIREEQTEYQWLEEAGYKVLYNKNGILGVEQWMTGTAAYPDSVTRRVVIDIETGSRMTVMDVLTDLSKLASLVKTKQDSEIKKATDEMQKDPEAADADPAQLFERTNFTADDFKDFSIDDSGVTFYYDYGFPHVLEALQPPGEFRFTWSELKPFIRPGGLLARFVS